MSTAKNKARVISLKLTKSNNVILYADPTTSKTASYMSNFFVTDFRMPDAFLTNRWPRFSFVVTFDGVKVYLLTQCFKSKSQIERTLHMTLVVFPDFKIF